MNLSEFKAWFEGFTESMEGLPNEKQWARIQERVGEITADPTPYPVFQDRYITPHQHWWTYNTEIMPLLSGTGTSPTVAGQAVCTSTAALFAEVGRADAYMIASGGSA